LAAHVTYLPVCSWLFLGPFYLSFATLSALVLQPKTRILCFLKPAHSAHQPSRVVVVPSWVSRVFACLRISWGHHSMVLSFPCSLFKIASAYCTWPPSPPNLLLHRLHSAVFQKHHLADDSCLDGRCAHGCPTEAVDVPCPPTSTIPPIIYRRCSGHPGIHFFMLAQKAN